MKSADATSLGRHIAAHIAQGDIQGALQELKPTVATKTPFAMLDRIGAKIGAGELINTNAFLEELVRVNALGVWAILGSALTQQLGRDFCGALSRTQEYIVRGDVWYACDVLGERMLGCAWVTQFEKARLEIGAWRVDHNRWVRRSVGVGIHVWAKRSRGDETLAPQAIALFEFLTPLFGERDMDAVKGIGWALKTLGKQYPNLAAGWLCETVARENIYRALMLTKAMTYLNKAQRAQILKARKVSGASAKR